MGTQQPVNWGKEILLFMALNSIWVVMALFAVWLGWRSYTLSTKGSLAQGTVVRILEDDKAAFDSDFNPVVEFQVNGTTYTVQSQNNYRWWNRYTRFPIGGQVQMLYDPANPQSAEVNSWFDIWTEPLLLAIFTAIIAVALNVYLLIRWRAMRSTRVSV